MNNLRNTNIKGKKVLVRVDFNAPLSEGGEVTDDFRINKAIPTLEYLRSNGAKVIVITHLGRPKGKELQYSIRPIARKLWELMGGRIKFVNDTVGKAVEKEVSQMEEGDIIVLENLRFYKEEKENNEEFSKQLARLGDIFVQDGFGVCHRAHSSIVGVPKYIPSYPGLLLEEEIRVLSNVLVSPDRPLVSIIGGSKVSTKTRVIERLLDKSDYLLLGGKIANSLLVAKGQCIKDLLSEDEEDLMEVVKGIDLTSQKLHLPIDGMMALNTFEEEYSRVGAVGTVRREEGIFDIGPETIQKYRAILGEAKTIIWNGPLGFFEKKPFDKGTVEIAKMIADINSQVFSVVGGGETVELIQQMGIINKFDFVSTGGGAMLDFMAGKDLPGIVALEENSNRKKNVED